MLMPDQMQGGFQDVHQQRRPQAVALPDPMQGPGSFQAPYIMGYQSVSPATGTTTGSAMTTVATNRALPGAASKDILFNGQPAGLGGPSKCMPQTFQEADFPECNRIARQAVQHGVPLQDAGVRTVPHAKLAGRPWSGSQATQINPSSGSTLSPWGPQRPMMHTSGDLGVEALLGAVDRDMDLSAARVNERSQVSAPRPCAIETWDPLSGPVMDVVPPANFANFSPFPALTGPPRTSGLDGVQDISDPFTGCPGAGMDNSQGGGTAGTLSGTAGTEGSWRVFDQGFPSKEELCEDPSSTLQNPSTACLGSGGSSLGPSPATTDPAPPAVNVDGYQASVLASTDRVSTALRRPKKQKNASFFVSSPGAISSDTRDASVQQGKFDMASVLQMQLSQDIPCLACDLSGGTIMVTNMECEELFQMRETNKRLCQAEISSLVHEDDRDQFSTCLAYQMVSERTQMDSQEIRIVTGTGRTRLVRMDGIQLIGLWWQLRFSPLDEPQATLQRF